MYPLLGEDPPPLKGKELEDYHSQLGSEWNLKEEKSIQREFTFEGFKEAVSFVNDVAKVAEDEGHHPDIHIFYNKVKIELSTHAIKGLSKNDFILAAKLDELYK